MAKNVCRITLKSIRNDVLEILNLERGLLYTIRELVLAPQKTVDTYLFKDRSKVFNPFRFIFFAVGVFTFLILKNFTSINILEYGNISGEGINTPEEMEVFNDYIEGVFSYYNISVLISIPAFAFLAFLIFGREKYNYAEHLAINSYVFGLASWVGCIFLAIGVFFKPLEFIIVSSIFYVLVPIIWYKRIYAKKWWFTLVFYILIYSVGSTISGLFTLLLSFSELQELIRVSGQ